MPSGYRKDGTRLGFKKGNKINSGRKQTSEHIRKRMLITTQKLIGKKHTKQHNINIGLGCLGNKSRTGMKNSEKWKKIMSEKMSGEKHWHWKGDDLKDGHQWIRRKFGKAENHKCKLCEKQAHDWSNIDHKYRHNVEDWQALCRGCHMRWDYKFNNFR